MTMNSRLLIFICAILQLSIADHHRIKRQNSPGLPPIRLSLPQVSHNVIENYSKSPGKKTTNIMSITESDRKFTDNLKLTTTESTNDTVLQIQKPVNKGYAEDDDDASKENKNPIIPQLSESQPLVATSYGVVKGIIVHNDVMDYYSFRAIPYAEKPKRFQAPLPPKPWKGIRDATIENKPCFQKDNTLGFIGGSEDCLYLNVNTPTLEDKRLPVMVWIHGGAYKFGSANSLSTGPQYLINEGLVVVNVYYRLGAFGFLSTGTKDVPGNAGMKDVVAALKWIKKNMHMFGGDTHNVCVYGISSGSSIVDYLSISPMARGLFDKAIIHSGFFLNTWSFINDPLKNAFSLGHRLGFEDKNVKKLVEFLQKANASDIVTAVDNMDADIISPYGLHFTPCIEKGNDGFLLDYPENILKSGAYTRVPLMIGFNNNEGYFFVRNLIDVSEYLTTYDDLLEYTLPPDLLASVKSQSVKNEIIRRVREFYFKGQPLIPETLQNFIDLLGDSAYIYGACKTIKIRSDDIVSPLYCYEFALGDQESGLHITTNNIILKGAAHADDMAYVFNIPFRFIIEKNKIAKNTSKRLLRLFSNFLKYGNPTPSPSELLPIILPPVSDNTTIPYLSIEEDLKLKYDPFKERCDFITQLYSLSRASN